MEKKFMNIGSETLAYLDEGQGEVGGGHAPRMGRQDRLLERPDVGRMEVSHQ